MNFFESQETARRNTTRLVVLFAFAVISLILMTNVLLVLTLGLAGSGLPYETVWQTMDWRLFGAVSLAVLLVITVGSLYKISMLSGGGARVAEMMQASLIPADSTDPAHRRILNVVEEMAIASGTPVPPVYLMEEQGINAFAAGYSSGDAVIGVTRGAIEKLTRDELQGVIAHEFSHILHGDMRLNIRLIGLLHGILVIGLIGYMLLRSSPATRRSKNSGNQVFLGIGLVVIGYSGTFFGNLIKSAVSRQREFLADASAVQYTRNPDGIGNALRRIGGNAEGARINNPAGAEISHALFGEGHRQALNFLFATHPPLKQRISKILPGWDGSFLEPASIVHESENDGRSKTATGSNESIADLASMIAHAGNPGPEHLAQAQGLIAAMPTLLLSAAHQSFSARALMYLLLLDLQPEIRQKQLAHLAQQADASVMTELQRLVSAEPALRPEHRLPLINLAMPSLRQLSQPQYQVFKANLQWLMAADGKLQLSEWVLQRLLIQHLDGVFEGRKMPLSRARRSLAELAPQCAVLTGFLVHAGSADDSARAAAFQKAEAAADMPAMKMPVASELGIEAVNDALDELRFLKPLQRPALLKACAAVIESDGRVTVVERELFRALAEALDCPMPPLSETSQAAGSA